jgi:hypothetical protein
MTAAATRRSRFLRALVGARPRGFVLLLVPTILALAIDVALRGRELAGFPCRSVLIYFSSVLLSAGLWILPLALATRLFVPQPGRIPPLARRAGLALFFGVGVLPLTTLSYAGQVLYHRVFHLYMGRDSVRLGIALRDTVRVWFLGWASTSFSEAMLLAGLAMTLAIAC